MPPLRRDVQRGRVRDPVPGRDDHGLVELHELLQHRHRALAGGDVRAGAAVLEGIKVG